MGIIPQRLRASPAFQRVLRVLQFLSAIISLGLFSSRLYKIIRLLRHASASNGAVEGILAAAALYTLLAMLLRFVIKGSGSSILRWLLVLLDILFVIAFIVVAVLTSPKRGGSSGPCHSQFNQRITPKGYNCNLPIGVFVLAILSTILHALTAIFHEVKDHHNKQKHENEMGYKEGESQNQYNGTSNHQQNGRT